MKISKMAQAVETSLSRELFNMAKKYDDVIDLTLGDPDVLPASKIREAACAAVNEGQTRYSANAGLLELRNSIGRCFSKEYGVTIDSAAEVIVTVGGMEALYLTLACLIDAGDEVIIHAPYYVNYVQMVRMCGGSPVIINTYEDNGFMLTPEQIENAITDRTVAIILNSPCNPTGVVLGEELLDCIADMAKAHDLTVISDEVYRTMLYDGKRHESIVTRLGMRERTVVIDSLSKRFAMTGYRVGYAIAPEELIANMTKMQENIAACAPLPSQHAGIAAYNECAEDGNITEIFQERRKYIYQAVNEIKGLHCLKPDATFYLFVNIEQTGLDCLTFAYKLLETQHVAVAPGITYGKEYNNYIRIAYTLEIDKLKQGIERMERFVAYLQGTVTEGEESR